MQKNSITNKITPCCGLPFSVVYWWVSNLTLNSEADRQFILSKISQNGILSIDGWKVLINSGTLETDASLTKAEFLAWFNCGKQPSCEQLKLIIEGYKLGVWVGDLNEIRFENVLGVLEISDPAPTTVGLYRLSEVGIYTNLGGLETTAGKINDAYFDGTTWKLIAVEVGLSEISSIDFRDNRNSYVNDNYDSIETIRTPSSYPITSTSYSITSNYNSSNLFNSKVLVFDSSIIDFNNITWNDSRNIQWIIIGKNNSGNYLALGLTNGSTSVGVVTFTSGGSYSSLAGITSTSAINLTNSFSIKYTATSIELYQNGNLIITILRTTYNLNTSNYFGIAITSLTNGVDFTVSCNYQIKNITNDTPTVTVAVDSTTNFAPNIVLEGSKLRYKQNKKGKIITLYGDSITVAYDSANYVSGILSKTGASVVNRKGVSAQSFGGQLQSDANISTITATNPDVVILHSVNDHRNNVTIGTMADAAGTASLYGGLKKICNALISYNKNIKIVICTPLGYGQISSVPGSDGVNTIGKYLHEYANAMRDFASNYGITIVDLSQKCGFRPQIESTANRVYTSDGVHPNATGYEVMTTLIAEEINKLN